MFGCSLKHPTYHAEETWAEPVYPESILWCGHWLGQLTSSCGACASPPVVPGIENVLERCTHRKSSDVGFLFCPFGTGRKTSRDPSYKVALCTASPEEDPVLTEGSGIPLVSVEHSSFFSGFAHPHLSPWLR